MIQLSKEIRDKALDEGRADDQKAFQEEAMRITLGVRRDHITGIGPIMQHRDLVDAERLDAASSTSSAPPSVPRQPDQMTRALFGAVGTLMTAFKTMNPGDPLPIPQDFLDLCTQFGAGPASSTQADMPAQASPSAHRTPPSVPRQQSAEAEPGSESTLTLRTQPSQAPPPAQTTPPSVSRPLRAEGGFGSGSVPTVARKRAKKRTGWSALRTQCK